MQYVRVLLIFVRFVHRVVERKGSTQVALDDLDALKDLSSVLRHEMYSHKYEASLVLPTRYYGISGVPRVPALLITTSVGQRRLAHVVTAGKLFGRARGLAHRTCMGLTHTLRRLGP